MRRLGGMVFLVRKFAVAMCCALMENPKTNLCSVQCLYLKVIVHYIDKGKNLHICIEIDLQWDMTPTQLDHIDKSHK